MNVPQKFENYKTFKVPRSKICSLVSFTPKNNIDITFNTFSQQINAKFGAQTKINFYIFLYILQQQQKQYFCTLIFIYETLCRYGKTIIDSTTFIEPAHTHTNIHESWLIRLVVVDIHNFINSFKTSSSVVVVFRINNIYLEAMVFFQG